LLLGALEDEHSTTLGSARGRKHMAHKHGSEYQVRIVLGDGSEELSGWLNSAEQVAQAIASHHKPQAKAYWLLERNVLCPNCLDQGQKVMEYPLADIPSPRYRPHDSRYLVEVGSKSRYELEVVVWNRHQAA
jgi:hypothetical protein